jgi:hypothetical protein
MFKDFIVALSLANLTFITIWEEVFIDFYEGTYFVDFPDYNSLKAVMFNVLLLTLILWGAMRLLRKSTSPVVQLAARALFLLLLIIPLSGAASLLYSKFWAISLLNLFGKVWLVAIGVTLGALTLYDLACARRYTFRAATVVLVLLSPFVVIQFGKAAWFWYEHTETVALAKDKPLAPTLPTKDNVKLRIVWVVFDELDYRLAFIKRPSSLRLPEFDRLRAQSIDASQAFSPGDFTLYSMPSLITGVVAKAASAHSRDELLLFLRDKEKTVRWSTLRNVFTFARKAGFNTGLAGWFHPYCRIIRDLTACSTQLRHWSANGLNGRLTVVETMLEQASELLPRTVPFVDQQIEYKNHKIRLEKQRHLELHLGVANAAQELIVDRSLGLVLIHYPVPHPPGIYDRRQDKFTFEPAANYLDNLQLADRTLGKLRHVMEEAKLWDDTIVLVTTDHPWRAEFFRGKLHWTPEEEDLVSHISAPDRRVPYLLKLAGQKQLYSYRQEFNTVITQELLLALLRGELTHPESVVRWLDQHRANTQDNFSTE